MRIRKIIKIKKEVFTLLFLFLSNILYTIWNTFLYIEYMNEKIRMLFWIVAICILGMSAYVYTQPVDNNIKNEDIPEFNVLENNDEEVNTWAIIKDIDKNIEDFSPETIPNEIIENSEINTVSTGSVKIKRTKILSNEADLEKSIYKDVSYKELFKNSMIKYPEILEYPGLLDEYIAFINDTTGVKYENIEMEKYESLWKDLHVSDLFLYLEEEEFWGIKWNTTWLSTMLDKSNLKNIWSDNCIPVYWDSWACFIIIASKEWISFIYDLYWKKSIIKRWNKSYILNNRSLLGVSKYSLLNYQWVLFNSFKEDIHINYNNGGSYSKWNIKLIYNSNDNVVSIYYKNKLVKKTIYESIGFTIDINNNLFNGSDIEYKVWNKIKVIKQSDYKDLKEIESHVSAKIKLHKIYKWYKLVWEIIPNKDSHQNLETISVLNCKNNDIDITDDWYTLKEYKLWDTNFTYNISEEYGNYCKGWLYKIKAHTVETYMNWDRDEFSEFYLHLE